jgi:formylglycine-generating enzyme required for sulfatase activity/tRNA A-37 threonylcarbamoyl transferase component Bud32
MIDASLIGVTFHSLADEYLARLRNGERPSIEDYAMRYPALADEIRELFPALSALTRIETSVPPPSNPTVPRRLGDFLLLREIGRGGMGVVYEAMQETLGRKVAVKVLIDSFAVRNDAVRRFQREAKAAARLHHTNIVPVFGVGEQGGTHYFAMQFISGQGLDRVLAAVREKRSNNSSTTPETIADETGFDQTSVFGNKRADYYRNVARLMAEAADALTHAHGRGVLHRDIKPSNLILDLTGTLWVTDFGLAKVDNEADLTEPDTPVGTLRYMPPERLNGQADALGDVYSLGATLYELLTLKPLYDRPDKLQMLDAIRRHVPPIRPRDLDPRIPRDLETICLKCTDPESRRRYPSAAAVASDLRAFLAGSSIQARPAGVIEKGMKWAKRNPTRAVVAAAFLLFLAASTVGFVLADRAAHARQERAHAEGLVTALASAETASVPELLVKMDPVRDRMRSRLADFAAQPIGTKPGLHARMALVDEPRVAGELMEYIVQARADELIPLREVITDCPQAWPALESPLTPGPARVRYAAALAGWSPSDPRWPAVAPAVVEALLHEPSLDVGTWARALEPVGGALLPDLLTSYRALNVKTRPGRFTTPDTTAAAATADRAADLVARFAANRPDRLAEAVVEFEGPHLPRLFTDLQRHRNAVLPLLKRSMAGEPQKPITVGRALAAIVKLDTTNRDDHWRLLSRSSDSTARTEFIHRCASMEVSPNRILDRLTIEPEVSARRALLSALGGYRPDILKAERRMAFSHWLLERYRSDPDAGVRSLAGWLIRRGWADRSMADRIDGDLAGRDRADGRNWYLTRDHQTMVVLPGPARLKIGSTADDPEGESDESAALRIIPRTVAIGATEITADQYTRLMGTHPHATTRGDCAMNAITWFQAAEYCNRLSEREEIPSDQWCYEPNADGKYASGMRAKAGYLNLKGYRLPTEAEWEYACRAGTTCPRYFGGNTDLIAEYAWTPRTANLSIQPVALLRPNEFGLFDTLGNVIEWVGDPKIDHELQSELDAGPQGAWTIFDGERDGSRNDYQLRGGGYSIDASRARAAYRYNLRPGNGTSTSGFRIARTVATHTP